MKKRVHFTEGMQKRFLLDLKEKTKLEWIELSIKLKVNINTLSKAYLYELCDMPYELFKKIILLFKLNEKDILRKYNAILKKEKVVIGRKVLGEQKTILSKIKITFKEKNTKLDISRINYSRYDVLKKIKFPDQINEDLAEEIGMHLGDGFLSSSRYEYRLKGNPADEKLYYDNYIKPLFKKLYNLEINPRKYTQSYGFELKSKALWEFKSRVLGIKTGDKNSIKLPDVIKVNDYKILCALLRGLFDTDGCLYFRSGYGYQKYYPTITLTLASQKLIKEVGEIMLMLGFKPGIYFYKDHATIRLNGISSFQRYEELIGWSSQKNLKRALNWKNMYPEMDKNMAVIV